MDTNKLLNYFTTNEYEYIRVEPYMTEVLSLTLNELTTLTAIMQEIKFKGKNNEVTTSKTNLVNLSHSSLYVLNNALNTLEEKQYIEFAQIKRKILISINYTLLESLTRDRLPHVTDNKDKELKDKFFNLSQELLKLSKTLDKSLEISNARARNKIKNINTNIKEGKEKLRKEGINEGGGGEEVERKKTRGDDYQFVRDEFVNKQLEKFITSRNVNPNNRGYIDDQKEYAKEPLEHLLAYGINYCYENNYHTDDALAYVESEISSMLKYDIESRDKINDYFSLFLKKNLDVYEMSLRNRMDMLRGFYEKNKQEYESSII